MSGMELWKEKQVNSMGEFWKTGREEERNIFIDEIVVKEKNFVFVDTSKKICVKGSRSIKLQLTEESPNKLSSYRPNFNNCERLKIINLYV